MSPIGRSPYSGVALIRSTTLVGDPAVADDERWRRHHVAAEEIALGGDPQQPAERVSGSPRTARPEQRFCPGTVHLCEQHETSEQQHRRKRRTGLDRRELIEEVRSIDRRYNERSANTVTTVGAKKHTIQDGGNW